MFNCRLELKELKLDVNSVERLMSQKSDQESFKELQYGFKSIQGFNCCSASFVTL